MLVNGIESDLVPVADRGFQYGDGLFETLAVENGVPEFLSRHLERLQKGCERLDIDYPGDQLLSEEAFRIAKGATAAILKIIVTRGCGGRGYRIPERTKSTRVISIHPRREVRDELSNRGIRAKLCRTRLGINPSLAGLKHLNRLEQILARSEWNDPQIQEGLMLDSEGYVIEGTMSNLFLVRSGGLETPQLDRCGVAGIIRALVLGHAQLNNIPAEIKRLTVGDLESADEIFITNSVIGIWPVVEFNGAAYDLGRFTLKFMQWLNARRQKRSDHD